MKVDKELIKRVASASRLKLNDEEIEKFIPQFKEILNAFSTVDDVNINGVEPSFHPVELSDKMREDLVEESFSQKDALANSSSKDGYIKGPRVV